MTHKIEGIVPVMLTPFTDQDEIDYPGLEQLLFLRVRRLPRSRLVFGRIGSRQYVAPFAAARYR
jgi:hypothetical protein